MNKYILKLILVMVLAGGALAARAQSFPVSGRVVDPSGQPLAGVTVFEEGTTNGTSAGAAGEFQLSVRGESSTLTFSFVGYLKQQVPVGKNTRFEIVLHEDIAELDEVIVVGYGVQRKASVVGAISTADPQDLQKTGTTNLTQALGGRVAGVTTKNTGGRPGEDDAGVWIRGRASYQSGATAPLVLVDGLEREYSQIDPEDIESFSVLKDASATAVYGVRGANGVILITTKRGETAKPVVDLRANVMLSQPTRLPKKLGSYDYARLMNEALANVGEVPEYTAYDLDMYRTGESPFTHPDNDYLSDLLKNTSVKQQYNMTVRGGTPFVKYYISANYLDERGMYKKFDNDMYDTNVFFKRYGMRSNLDFNVTRTTSFGVDMAGRFEERHNNGAGDELYIHMVRTPPNYFNYVNPDGSLGGNLNLVNPYAALSRYGYDHSRRNVFELALKLNQKLDAVTPGLSARVMFGFVAAMRSRRDLYERPELWKYTKDERYEPIQEAASIAINTSAGPHTRNITLEAGLNYDRTFGDHAVTGLLAFNRLETHNNASLPGGYINYVGRVTYGYKNKYLAEVNAGYNGSMQFAKGHRYGFFPAFSAGWVVSQENFWKDGAKIFTYLKLRGSYGEVGNDRIGSSRFYYLQTYPLNTIFRPSFGEINQGENYIYEGKLGSQTVGWERARKLNFGFDSRFFNSKMSLSVDVFHERRTDILDYDMTVDLIFGMYASNHSEKGFAPQNLGEVKNYGFEAELGYNDKAGKLNYYISGTFSFARNEIRKRGEAPVTYDYLSWTGKRIGQRFGLVADGFYNSEAEIEALPSRYTSNLKPGDLKYRDMNGDGVIDSYDVVPIGRTALPEIMYGITLGGDYKGFDLSLFFQGAANSDLYASDYNYWEFTNSGGVMEHHLGRWTPDTKDTATYPSLSPSTSTQNHRLSTFWLHNGAYIRLKNVQLGYTVPSELSRKIGISNLRVHVSGTNLFTWSKMKQYDPESNDGDGTKYPQMKFYNLGLSVRF